MDIRELRDTEEARRFLTQGLWWQRVLPVRAEFVAEALDAALAIASAGDPLPPIGFVADVGHMIFHAAAGLAADTVELPGWPASLLRAYEDYVLGKLLADSAFDRAADALRPYQGRQRFKGLAFLVEQMRQRTGLPGILLSPAALKAVRDAPPEDILAEGWESILEHGPMPLVTHLYEQLVGVIRVSAALLGPEDVFELERGTALAEFGQRLALRQVLHAAQTFIDTLPRRKPPAPGRRREVPTRLIEEDTYPVGGFSSIATRGSIESMLHSQLAYMEREDRPDLFDIKFLRDELLYYARDENNFLRRRRTFVFALYPDLVQARFKDAGLPCQRIIALLALLLAAVRKLIDWLSTEALLFEVVLVGPSGTSALAAEKELLEVLLAEQIANGTVTVTALTAGKLQERCAHHARRSLCHCLLASAQEQTLDAASVAIASLTLAHARPALGVDGKPVACHAETDWEAWTETLERLLGWSAS